jgi:hypothetical protein
MVEDDTTHSDFLARAHLQRDDYVHWKQDQS